MKKMRWLIKNITPIAMIIIILTMIIQSTGLYSSAEETTNELIANSTFDSGTDTWNLYLTKDGAGSFNVIDGELAISVDNQGQSDYSVQLYSELLAIYQDAVYDLSFDIYSDIDSTIKCRLQEISDDYTNYFWCETNVTTEKTTHHFRFTQSKGTDLFSRLTFNFGYPGYVQEQHTIYLDNISLQLSDDTNVIYPTNTEEDILINQVGYYPTSTKTAVFRNVTSASTFDVVNVETSEVVFTGLLSQNTEKYSDYETDWYGDFSDVIATGTYYIQADGLTDSYPFTISNSAYSDLLESSLHMFYLQRCGCAVEDDQVNHSACHTSLATIYGTEEQIDVSGGWHDAGDYGRYVVAGAKAVADLLLSYASNPSLFGDDTGIPESSNGISDLLDEVRYELEWMLKMQDSSTGGVYHKVTCLKFASRVSPEDETGTLYVTPVSTTATGDFAAVMAMAYEYYYSIDRSFAKTCLKAAKSAYSFLEKNPDLIFENPSEITTGAYSDASDVDERYWATAQLYRATGSKKYLKAFLEFRVSRGMGWATVGDYGNIAYLTMNTKKLDRDRYQEILDNIEIRADEFAEIAATHNYDISFTTYPSGSNMKAANNANFLIFADSITSTPNYTNIAKEHLHYLLGKNPLAKCFVTGYGTDSPLNPHHRISIVINEPVDGMLVGGVNSDLQDFIVKAYCEDLPAAKCYVDHVEASSTNEVTIYWNSSLVYLLTNVITSEAPSAVTQNVLIQDYVKNQLSHSIITLKLRISCLPDITPDWKWY